MIENHKHDERIMILTHGGVMRILVEQIIADNADLPTRFENLGHFVVRVE